VTDPSTRDVLRAFASFARTRWGYRFSDRAALMAWQRGRVRRLLAHALPRAAYYGRAARDLAELPIIDRTTQFENFAALNTRGIPLERAYAVASAAERSSHFEPMLDDTLVRIYDGPDGGARTFLISQKERMLWVGAVLARGMSTASLVHALSPWRRPLVITLVGARGSGLFDALPTRRLRFIRVDPSATVAEQIDELNENPPDVLVGPPSTLLSLSDAQRRGMLRITPRQIILVAETIDEVDGIRLHDAFGAEVRHIYQTPEGMLAFTCPRGTVHLAEEHVRFEKYWLDAEHTRFVPVVTAFLRNTQLVVRLRLDDVLRISKAGCACRWHGLAIAGVDGKTDAILTLPRAAGAAGHSGPVSVFPDSITGALSLCRSDGLFEDWRVLLRSDVLVVNLLAPRPGAERAVERGLDRMFAEAGAEPPDIRFEDWLSEDPGVRVRRIRTL
jgi:putative adenylate-forming enzyme